MVTFLSFAIFGLMPLLPFIIAKAAKIQYKSDYVIISSVLTVFFLFVLGFSKSLVVLSKWYLSSGEAILIGFLSAAAAYGMGKALNVG
jgi:VIT1/CCC1 family predicted Fe2+/Mn2+ transporter